MIATSRRRQNRRCHGNRGFRFFVGFLKVIHCFRGSKGEPFGFHDSLSKCAPSGHAGVASPNVGSGRKGATVGTRSTLSTLCLLRF